MKAAVCFLVGEGLLALETVRALTRPGFQLAGVLSQDAAVASFCEQNAITLHSQRAAFVAALTELGLDLLFSVNNPWIVPADVLALPRRAAINFHDSPLPRYGGLFATSWALINGEAQHGVSWHIMRPGIDSGEILVQRTVSVRADDTAHTLNARCFEAAREGMGELLGMLHDGRVCGWPQPAIQGSYHGLADRPWAAGLLDFTHGARSLERLVRALDFGTAINPFAAAKCALAGELFIVAAAQATSDPGARAELSTRVEAGRCLACTDAGLTVQTGDGILILKELRSLQGERVGIEDCARRLGIRVGQQLSSLDRDQARRLDARFRAQARHEPFWIRQLTARAPGRILPSAGRRSAPRAWPLTRFAELLAEVSDPQRPDTGALIAAFAARLGAVELGLGVADLSPLEVACFAEVVPLRIGSSADQSGNSLTLHEHRACYKQARDERRQRGSYARDLVARTPALRQHGERHYELSIFDADANAPSREAPVDGAFMLRAGQAPQLVSYTQLSDAQLDTLDHALATFARAALARPDVAIDELPLLDDGQVHTMAHGWNATATADFPRRATLPGLFSAQAARSPNARALRHGERTMSYRELDERSSMLAAVLREAGVVPGARVLVSLPHGLSLVLAFLGVMKAGAAYVPVDTEAPAGRRDTILTAAEPVLTICEPAARERWAAHGACLTLDGLAAPAAWARADGAYDGEDVACVIFTSGSTGTPKGVEVVQRGLVNHALAVGSLYQLAAGDRVLCTASVGFDLCGEQIYPALLAGAEVVMRPADLFDSVARFESFLRSAEITTLILAAGFWHEWMQVVETTAAQLPPSLRVVAVGAEKVLTRHAATFDRVTAGKVRLFQGYGPTEATITCTMYEHAPGTLPEGEDMPIGRPLANVQTYVLDARHRPLPVGIAGDLYVAGAGLARGYLTSPALTAERFVPNPFRPGTLMYRTGDRARYRQDGQIIFLGRQDSQIKLRGFRVELAEIETALSACPGVTECVVMLTQPEGASERLVAYVARLPTGPELSTAALRSQLEERLPAYMIPTDWLLLDALPRTLNHKVDKAALPPPNVASAPGRERAPETPLEQALCALVAELFPGRAVHADDDFFRDLGGDSLLAIRLMGRIEAAHDVDLALSDFARDATVRALARRLTGGPALASPGFVTIQPGLPGERSPLWLLPAVGGHVLYGEQLRRAMAAAQPVYGLEAPGLRESERALERIEDMAEAYLRTILSVQPHGPYVIAGPSLGGLAAWQIASQLAQRGESRVTVVLLDTWAPGYPRALGRLERLRDQAEHLLRQPSLSALWKLVLDRLDWRVRKWSGVPRYTAADNLEGVRGERIREVVRCSQAASEAYHPPRLTGRVVLFRATENGHSSGVRFDGNDNGWGPLSNPEQLRVIPVATHHVELSDHPPAVVGALLQGLLDELPRSESLERTGRRASRPSGLWTLSPSS